MGYKHCWTVHFRKRLTELHPLTHLAIAVTLSIIGIIDFSIHLPYIIFGVIQCPLAVFGGVSHNLSKRGAVIVLPFFVFLFAIYGAIHPDAKNILFSWWVFDFSQEGLISAYRVFGRVLVVMTAFLYFSLMIKPSKLVQAISQAGIPWFVGYIVLATLQTVPQLTGKASAIMDAQRTRGLETEGGFFNRMQSIIPLLKPLVFSSIVKAQERAFFLETSGAGLEGRKTYLYDLIDHPHEKAFRIICIVIIMMCLVYKIWSIFI